MVPVPFSQQMDAHWTTMSCQVRRDLSLFPTCPISASTNLVKTLAVQRLTLLCEALLVQAPLLHKQRCRSVILQRLLDLLEACVCLHCVGCLDQHYY